MNVEIGYWNKKYFDEGYFFRVGQTVRINMEYVDKVRREKGFSDFAIEVATKDLQSRGLARSQILSKTLQRSRKGGKTAFCSVYALAIALEEPLHKIAMVTTEKPDTQSSESERPVFIPHDVVEDIEKWIKIVILSSISVAAIYAFTLFVGWYSAMDVGFPLVGILSSALSGYTVRSKSHYPMPINLQRIAGLLFGTISGALSFLAVTEITPLHANDFGDWNAKIAIAAYISGTVFGFLFGHSYFNFPRERSTAIYLGITASFLSISMYF